MRLPKPPPRPPAPDLLRGCRQPWRLVLRKLAAPCCDWVEQRGLLCGRAKRTAVLLATHRLRKNIRLWISSLRIVHKGTRVARPRLCYLGSRHSVAI